MFSLPFCLLLPDGDYAVKLGDDTVTLNLSKVIPTVFDERLPFRGFLKGEFENVSKLWIAGKLIDAEDLQSTKEFGIVTKYIDKEGKEVVPQLEENDVNLHEPEIMNKTAKEKFSKIDDIPQEWIDWYTKQEHYLGRQLVINTEVKKDSYGRFRYTKIKYTSSNPTKKTMDEQFRSALKATNMLIDIYRTDTSDYWITNVKEKNIFIYKSVSEKEMQTGYSTQGFSRIRSDHDTETVKRIREKLTDPQPQFPYLMLMLDAEKSLDDNKYYLSVIYSIIALESIVKVYVILYTKKKGISQKIEEKLNSLHLHFLITVILRMFVRAKDFDDDLISNVIKGVTLRNKIIHESNLDVSENDARNTMSSVKKVAAVLMEDINQYYTESGSK